MILSLRRLLEKRREQRHPLYVAFIDLIRVLDLVWSEPSGSLYTVIQEWMPFPPFQQL